MLFNTVTLFLPSLLTEGINYLPHHKRSRKHVDEDSLKNRTKNLKSIKKKLKPGLAGIII